LDVVTDITKRVAFEEEFKKNSAAYIKFVVTDEDTPEIIAFKFYGDVEKHWIVLMMNDIIDPQFDWPMKERDLIKFIDNKYSANAANNQTGLDWAKTNNQAYYKVENKTLVPTGEKSEDKMEVDSGTYANITPSSAIYTLQNGQQLNIATSKETVTYFEYQTELNDNKRNIILLRKEFVPAAMRELKTIFDINV
jgi:hypothetical protein